MKRGIAAILLTLVLFLAAAAPAWAYSYGDPNEEEVAVMFKEAVAKIQTGDWAGALPLYQAKRAEIESHFGAELAATLDQNFEAKDRAAVEQNLKALLVLNLERRFTYGAKDINDYSQTKLLLAKARATYDTLEPYIQAKLPDEPAKLRAAFDAALEALGNPGLFGVGKKPVNPDEYNAQTAYVLKTLTPLFPYKAAQAPAQATAPTQKQTDETVTRSTPQPAAATAQPSAASPKAAAQQPAEASAAPEAGGSAPAVEASASPSASAASTPAASEADATLQPSATPEPADASAPSPAALEAAAHAPMAREDKTNIGVTLAVFGGVAAAAGGLLWWFKRKGIL